MNIEQAVQNLEDIKSKYTWSIGADDALDMAISALRAQNLQQTCNRLATNTIDRQAAINAIRREYNGDDSDFPTDYQLGLSAARKIIEQLPSAQPEPIQINLNDPIKVKLTDWGKEIYYHQYDGVNKAVGREVCKPEYPTEDENGYTEFQLWCFIELYGMHIGMTLPNVIKPLEIVYKR